MPTLTKETLKELKLVPDGIPESARGSDIIKRLLSNLGTIGNALAELRGLYGTGHRKHGKTSGLSLALRRRFLEGLGFSSNGATAGFVSMPMPNSCSSNSNSTSTGQAGLSRWRSNGKTKKAGNSHLNFWIG